VENLSLNARTEWKVFVCVGILAGCGATIPLPAELLNARQAYAHASMNPGAQLVPADLQKARDALGMAEQSFLDDPSSHRTRDLADHANREARIAERNASTASDSVAAADEKHRPTANPR
jgi:hypothetical protein